MAQRISRCPFINNLWSRHLGEKEDWSWLEKKSIPSYESLLESEWDEEFWDSLLYYRPKANDTFKSYARNRMVMGAMRYGTLSSENYKGYDHLSNFNSRMERGMDTLNLECFVDAYNIAYLLYLDKGYNSAKRLACDAIMMYELFHDDPEWSFNAEDDGEHCERIND